MRVYFDTGVFIDYLSTRGNTNAILRSSGRRGRTPASMAVDAERLFERVTRAHTGATSCLTYYEVEEALYRLLAQSAKGVSNAGTLLIPAARSITTQVQIVIELFNISVLDLTSGTVRLQLQQLNLQTRGIRAADSLGDCNCIRRRPYCLDGRCAVASGWNPYQYPWFENTLSRHGFVTSAFIEPARFGRLPVLQSGSVPSRIGNIP